MDEDKVGLKDKDWENKKEEDDNNLEVSDEDIEGTNDDKEADRPKKIKKEMPKKLRFLKVFVGTNDLLPQHFNRETMQESRHGPAQDVSFDLILWYIEKTIITLLG